MRPYRCSRFALIGCTVLVAAAMIPSFPAAATFPGENRRLVFGRAVTGEAAPDIATVRPNGRGLRILRPHPAFDACSAVSPDGRLIAFCSDRDGENFEIWVMSIRGTGLRQITHTGPGWVNLFPEFNAGGHRLAYMATRPDGNTDVYKIRLKGSHRERLTADPAFDGYPAFSPNRNRIAFISERTGSGDVYVMRPDGSDQTRLTFTERAVEFQLPDWSPNGNQIAFQSDRSGGGDIYVMDADGSDKQRLTTDPGFDFGPAWSPDGTKIAFVSERSAVEGRHIFVMDADGNDERQVTFGESFDFVPAWQPLP